MKLVFDIEATGAQRNHAHPYDMRNVACNIGIKNITTGETKIWKIQYDENPYGEALREIQEWVSNSTLLIGFNAKYDLHWFSRYNIVVSNSCRVFDCQLAYYIITNQQHRYPSLDGVAYHYGLPQKLDVVKTEYWDKGLDTNDVPYEILSEYLEQDLNVTHSVYNAIEVDLSTSSYEMNQLIKMSNMDLVVLQDIERNGLLVNVEKSKQKALEINEELSNIDEYLRQLAGVDWFNPNSGDMLSAFLYGGDILRDGKEDYIFTYKSGRTATKQRSVKIPHHFVGMFKPLEKTELAKDGFWATNEPTLTTLLEKAKGEYAYVLETILHRAKLEKRRGTYYEGYLKRMVEMGWDDNIVHTSYNQCVATTGRLSSTKPNVQNLEKQVGEIIVSRFKRRIT